METSIKINDNILRATLLRECADFDRISGDRKSDVIKTCLDMMSSQGLIALFWLLTKVSAEDFELRLDHEGSRALVAIITRVFSKNMNTNMDSMDN